MFLGKHGGNLFFLELYILRYLATRMPRMARYESHSNRTPTGTQRGDFMTMSHQYTYVHVRTRSPRNSVEIKHMRKHCIPGALSPPLLRAWEQGYFLVGKSFGLQERQLASETPDQRTSRLQQMSLVQQMRLTHETPDQRKVCLEQISIEQQMSTRLRIRERPVSSK